jgi:hypothetical protein
MSIPVLIQFSINSANLENTVGGVNWSKPSLYTTLSVDLTFTILIATRLLAHRHYIRKELGSKLGSHYTGVVAILVESRGIYSLCVLLGVVLFSCNSPAQYLFLYSLTSVQVSSLQEVNYGMNQKLSGSCSSFTECAKERHGPPIQQL